VKHIEAVFNREELSLVRAMIARNRLEDGAASALGMARAVKANRQFALADADARALTQLTFAALKRNSVFRRFALPSDVSVPMVNHYGEGMHYGPHYDSSLMTSPEGNDIRTDFSATVFVSGPDEYEGGHLSFDFNGVRQRFKYAAGDMLLYPAGLLHEVEPVTRGVRHAVVFWVQSKIAQDDCRSLLFRMDEAIGSLAQQHPRAPEVLELLGVFHSLSRMWMR
jgi:PKHD-type hydroxylase